MIQLVLKSNDRLNLVLLGMGYGELSIQIFLCSLRRHTIINLALFIHWCVHAGCLCFHLKLRNRNLLASRQSLQLKHLRQVRMRLSLSKSHLRWLVVIVRNDRLAMVFCQNIWRVDRRIGIFHGCRFALLAFPAAAHIVTTLLV